MSSRSKSKKRSIDQVTDRAILVAKGARDASDSIPVLTPLRGSLGMVIQLLENVKKARTNKEDWGSLVQTLEGRLKAVQDAIAGKPPSAVLQNLVSKYSEVLERATRELGPLVEGQANRLRAALSADRESKKIKDSIKEIDEAFNLFTTGLQMLMQIGIVDIQDKQEMFNKVAEAQGRAHTRAYDEQRKMMEKLQTEQKDTNVHISDMDEINLIKGLQTATMASGGIHRKCMEGTRQSILEQIERWRTDAESSQILWLADVAGSGKSTVAKNMAEKWKDQGCLAGRFFFSRDAEETRTPKLFFSTIAQQGLAQLDLNVRATVALGIRKLINPVSTPLEEQCSVIFVEPLKKVQVPTVLVLDALDECESQTCQQLLRTLLQHLPNLPHIKLFVTSRPGTHIRTELEDITYREVSLRSDELANSKDVELFMTQKLQKISLTEMQREQLIERAGGLFIWAKTVCDLLQNFRGNKVSFIDRIISQNLRQIDSIYRIALDQVIGSDTEEENMEAFINVLYVIVATFEPISPNTIDRLLKTSESMNIVNDLRSVLECGNSDSVIRFLHPTFREFLLNPDVCGRYHIDINIAHEVMCRGCLFVMGDELQYDICELYDGQSRKFNPEKLNEKCLQHTSSALRYSCVYWMKHIVRLNCLVRTSLSSMIEGLFMSKLLDWLYMVGIQGSIDKVSPVLQKMVSIGSSENVKKWSMDTLRFLRLHWNTIRDMPLKVYHEFAFAPRSSIFHQIYSKLKSFPHPIVVMGIEADWPSGITIQTHQIDSHRLSPSEDILATGGRREGIAVYTVWDVKTANSETFVHPCRTSNCTVNHVSFHQERDKTQLWTGCTCGKLCRWDISSDNHSLLNEMQLEVHKKFIWWSDDGTKAITEIQAEVPPIPITIPPIHHDVSLIDGLYRLYATDLPPTYHKLPGSYTDQWIFSPEQGKKLLQITGGTLTVWNCSSRQALFKKSYPNKKNRTSGIHACFSPDGTSIVCNSYPENFSEIISAEDGSLITTLPTPRLSTTFLPTGSGLLLWSSQAVSLFDGEFRRGVRIQCDSVSIAPDGQKIAVISSNSLDIFKHTLDERPEHHELNNLSLHDRGQNCLFIWRDSTVVFIEKLHGSVSFHHLSPITSSALSTQKRIDSVHDFWLSPDNRYLLTLSVNRRISLWDVKLGSKVHTTDVISLVHVWPQIKYAPDSSCALLWDTTKLIILHLPACLLQPIMLPFSSPFRLGFMPLRPMLPIATFFPHSTRFLFLQINGYMNTLSFDGSLQYPTTTLHLPILLAEPPAISLMDNQDPMCNYVQSLAISPTERLFAVCTDRGLIVNGIGQDVHQIPVLSKGLQCSEFSPDGAYIYALEKVYSRLRIFQVNTLDWIVKTIYVPEISFNSITIEPIHGKSWSAFRIDPSPIVDHQDSVDAFFINPLNARQIIPASAEVRGGDLWYGEMFLMALSLSNRTLLRKANDCIICPKDGGAMFVDVSLLIQQARAVQGFTDIVEIWRTKWLETLEKYAQKKREYAQMGRYGSYKEVLLMIDEEQQGKCRQKMTRGDPQVAREYVNMIFAFIFVRSYGSLEEVMTEITNGDQGGPFRARVEAIRNDAPAMLDLEDIWKDKDLAHIRKAFVSDSSDSDTESSTSESPSDFQSNVPSHLSSPLSKATLSKSPSISPSHLGFKPSDRGSPSTFSPLPDFGQPPLSGNSPAGLIPPISPPTSLISPPPSTPVSSSMPRPFPDLRRPASTMPLFPILPSSVGSPRPTHPPPHFGLPSLAKSGSPQDLRGPRGPKRSLVDMIPLFGFPDYCDFPLVSELPPPSGSKPSSDSIHPPTLDPSSSLAESGNQQNQE